MHLVRAHDVVEFATLLQDIEMIMVDCLLTNSTTTIKRWVKVETLQIFILRKCQAIDE